MTQELLNKPVWQMTDCELVSLLNSSRDDIGVVNTQREAPQKTEKVLKHYEYGIRGVQRFSGVLFQPPIALKKVVR